MKCVFWMGKAFLPRSSSSAGAFSRRSSQSMATTWKETVMKRMMYSLAALVLCAPLAAQAIEGWVVDDISLQAGPDPAYPSIIELAAGTPVSIQGCINGWTWCDIVVGADRGWVPGTFLEEDYGGQRVVVIDYGPRIGIPIVGFSLGVYWNQHYHNRPFYSQREQWVTK